MERVNLGEELGKLRRENQRLRQELRLTKKELEEWQHSAILLTPQEIFIFYKMYREKKKLERERKDQQTLKEIDKLMESVMDLKNGRGEDNEKII